MGIMAEPYIHIDLFSGIGGFTLGLHQAGLPIDKIYFSEIDKYAISVYRRQFPDAEYLGSVDTIPGRRFKGRKTIITFGFPCQDLSVAGKRKGFDGSRSSLFFEAMRIISEVRPSIFIFENVKGFYSSNNGKDFTIALQTIADLGLYECQWQLLNTAWFLPQNRERVYFVGSLGTGDRSEVFPIRNSNETIQQKRQNGRRFKEDGEPMFSLTTQDVHGVCIGDFRHDEGLRIRKNGNCPTLKANHNGSDISKAPLVMEKANCLTPDAYLTSGTRKRDENGKAILTSMCERRIRRLTPIECERLQGFPDNWTQYSDKGIEISDTQRYKMCGNAVSVPVVQAIGQRLAL